MITPELPEETAKRYKLALEQIQIHTSEVWVQHLIKDVLPAEPVRPLICDPEHYPEDGPDNPFYDCGAPQPPCLYCGENNWYLDLDGLARIVGCKNCGTKVPISIWKDASVSPGPFCEECAPLAVTTACILCQFKEEMTRRHDEYSKALNRRVDVENVLAAVAAGKREPLTREECKALAQKLGNA